MAEPAGNVSAPSGAPQFVIVPSKGPGLVVRAVWYLLVGWWLTGLTIGLGYFAALTIVGLPLAFYLFNRIPSVLTLRARNVTYRAETRDGVTHFVLTNPEQQRMWVRALWFVAIGWWAGAIWMGVAYLLCLLVLTIPLGLLMFNRVGAVMTLLRY